MILDPMTRQGPSVIDIPDAVITAEKNIRGFVRETPLDYSIVLSHLTGCHVYLKCEHLQYTGSFKIRGALNKLLGLTSEQRSQGVVTASSGNHGAAVAFGLSKLHVPGIVFVPEQASSTKVENIRNYGLPIEFYGKECGQTELYAIEYAKRHKMVYISPYNDPQVIIGQATIANELTYQLNQIDAVFVPIGGGGLIAGIGSFLKKVMPATQIIGCLPKNSPVMAESIKAGHIIEMETAPTLSDATAGGIEKDAMTFEMCQKYVDEYILAEEDEIEHAIIQLIQSHHFLIEGAAGVAVAAFLKSASRFVDKNIVIVLSGGNISLETLKVILA